MALIFWTDALSVKNESIDDQHRQLFEIADRMFSAVAENNGQNIVESILNELETYTKTHFSHEEELLYKAQFPEYDNHCRIHQKLIKQLEEFKVKIGKKKLKTAKEVNIFLENWIIKHILDEDKKYIDYIEK